MQTITTLSYAGIDKRIYLRRFDTVEQAETAAAAMIEQFRFWGAGELPISVVCEKVIRGQRHTVFARDYDNADTLRYARDGGDLECEYIQQGGGVCGE